MQKRFPDGVPLLDPVDDMGIKDPALRKIIQKVEAFEHRMYSHPLHSDPSLESVYALCEKKALVRRGGGGGVKGQELLDYNLTFRCLFLPLIFYLYQQTQEVEKVTQTWDDPVRGQPAGER